MGPGPTAGQTALPYTVGFALSPGDMMRQPPLAGFQGTVYTYKTTRILSILGVMFRCCLSLYLVMYQRLSYFI